MEKRVTFEYSHHRVYGALNRLRYLTLGALLALSVPAHALDFGGFVESETIAEQNADEQIELGLTNTARLFLRRNPVVEGPLTVRWDAQLSATSDQAYVAGEQQEDRWIFDVDRLDLRLVAPDAIAANSVLRGSVGRFPFADTTGLIFDDRVDGLSLSVDFPEITAAVSAGYTGLLAKENSAISVSEDDQGDRQDSDERFAPRRVVSNLSLIFPELVGRQSARIEGLAQWDVRDEVQVETVDSQYLYITGNGPLTEAWYYSFALAGSSLQRSSEQDGNAGDPQQEFGVAGQLQSELFLGARDRNLVTATIRYGSGADNGLDPFPSATDPEGMISGQSQVADTTLAMVDYSFNPYAGRRGAASRRLEAGGYTAAEYSATPTEEDAFRGFEVGSRINARPFPEFGTRIQGGLRYDNETDQLLPLGRIDLSARF